MILTGYVHGGMLHAGFAKSLRELYMYDKTPGKGRNLIGGESECQGLYVADNRNSVVRKFMDATYPDGNQPQWLMFFDSDIIFTPEQFYQLYDGAVSKGPCVYGGLYFNYTEGKPDPVWRRIHPEMGNKWGTLGKTTIGVVEPIDAVGMGFTLIHRKVLEAIPEANDNWRWFGHDLWQGERLGEDLTFCWRAKQAGYITWGDSNIVVGHMKAKIMNLSDFVREVPRLE